MQKLHIVPLAGWHDAMQKLYIGLRRGIVTESERAPTLHIKALLMLGDFLVSLWLMKKIRSRNVESRCHK